MKKLTATLLTIIMVLSLIPLGSLTSFAGTNSEIDYVKTMDIYSSEYDTSEKIVTLGISVGNGDGGYFYYYITNDAITNATQRIIFTKFVYEEEGISIEKITQNASVFLDYTSETGMKNIYIYYFFASEDLGATKELSRSDYALKQQTIGSSTDKTAPVLSEPTVKYNPNNSIYYFSIASNELALLCYDIRSSTDDAPTSDELVELGEGEDYEGHSTLLSANITSTISVARPGNADILYYCAEDILGNKSEVVKLKLGSFDVTSIASSTATSATIKYTSDMSGKVYYTIAASKVEDKNELENFEAITVEDGKAVTSSFTAYFSSLNSETGYISYYFEGAGLSTEIYYKAFSISGVSYGYPELSDITISRTSANEAIVSLDSNKEGHIFFIASTSLIKDKSALTSQHYLSTGNVKFDITGLSKESMYLYYYTSVGSLESELMCKTIEPYEAGDNDEPSFTNLYVLRPDKGYYKFVFTSNKACRITYNLDVDSGSTETKSVEAGENIIISSADDSGHVLNYWIEWDYKIAGETKTGKSSKKTILIPAYSEAENQSLIKIESIITSTTGFVNKNTGVVVSITAKSDVLSSPNFEYSFDGGITWSNSNEKIVTANTVFGQGQIRARVFGSISSSNVAIYPANFVVSNIDNTAPSITSISRSPEDSAILTNSVIFTVKAIDGGDAGAEASGIAAYSFDGGYSWQTENTFVVKINQVIPANYIQVKDAAGNITSYPDTIEISNIDSTAPVVTDVSAARATKDIGSIKFTTNEAGLIYYLVNPEHDDLTFYESNSRSDYFVDHVDTQKGENQITISDLEKRGAQPVKVAYYLVDNAGNYTSIQSVTIPAYTADDKTAPVIDSVSHVTDMSNTSIDVIIVATDDIALDSEPYSFDGGVHWQASNTYNCSKNTTFGVGLIKVRDAAGNITTYDRIVSVDSIDTIPPSITSVTLSLSNDKVLLTITATDNMGLNAVAPYSYDGGKTWSTNPSKIYSEATAIPAQTIQVRDNAGNITKYKTEITEAEMNSLISSVSNTFTDVKTTDWYFKYVQNVVDMGLFKGISDTEFGPNISMTRAMFVTVLGRLYEQDMSAKIATNSKYAKSSFTDVEVGQWYTPYVEWAYQAGIVKGYGNGIYGLNDPITREQMCLMLLNYLESFDLGESIDDVVAKNTLEFNDKSKINNWSFRAVSFCESLGIVVGDNNNNFRPQDSATRAEVATIICRFCGED